MFLLLSCWFGGGDVGVWSGCGCVGWVIDWFVGLTDGLVCVLVFVFVLHGLQYDETPLHHACEQSDNAAVVGLLLDRGADLHAKEMVSVIRHLTHAPITCASHLLAPVLHR